MLGPAKELITLPQVVKNSRHAWHLFIVQLELGKLVINRNEFIVEMSKQGIECGVHYQPVFELSFYKSFFELSLYKYPNAARAGQRVVTLPLYPSLKVSEVDFICDTAIDILKNNSR